MMTPTTNDTVLLANLNTLIAEQKNCTVDDLCTFVAGAPTAVKEVKEATPAIDSDIPAPIRAQATSDAALTDKDLAKSYRSQADAMYKEAARLRKEAEDLDPTVKKVKKAEETVDA
jgi:DNA repair ATPase RecN